MAGGVPTSSPQDNPWRVGDVVTIVDLSEGHLWLVVQVTGEFVDVERIDCALMGAKSIVRRIGMRFVDEVTVLQLCSIRAKLDTLIREVVRRKSGG